jgi:hypothetical protein
MAVSQEKLKIQSTEYAKVEHLHKWIFNIKGILLKYAVWNAFNVIKILLEVITEGVALACNNQLQVQWQSLFELQDVTEVKRKMNE